MAAMTIFWILELPECPIFRFRYRACCHCEEEGDEAETQFEEKPAGASGD